jgi:dCMP deaminase
MIAKRGRERLDWIETAMRLAFNIAKYRSQDPYIQVGACGLKYDGSIALGYNGAPVGVEIDWSDRNERRKRIIHAEANVLNLVKSDEIKLLAVTHLPCQECIKLITQKKIKNIYYAYELENYDKELTLKLAKEFGLNIEKFSREVQCNQ